MRNHTDAETALPLSNGILGDGLAAFLLRVAAYFQGCLSAFPSLPRMSLYGAQGHIPFEGYGADGSLTFVDASLAETSGPLIRVRMNRALTRRMRWLVRRGRITRSGRYSLATPQIEARCQLSAGQMAEYCIRVHGQSRVAAYGLGRMGCLPNLGAILSLGQALSGLTILTPD